MSDHGVGRLATWALLTICVTQATDAYGDKILGFSLQSSGDTPPSVLTATATFQISGSQMLIDIDNTSSYDIAALYFNSDTTLTALAFDPSSTFDPAWSISGSGLTQNQSGDGFGKHNWEIDFGNGATFLDNGLTTLMLKMTGTTSEDTIATKSSWNPPGETSAIAVMKFQAGPGGDSDFGTGYLAPLPLTAGMGLGLFCCLAVAGVIRRRWAR